MPRALLLSFAIFAPACISERDPVPPEKWCHETAGTVEVKSVQPRTAGDPATGEVSYVVVGDTDGKPLQELLNRRYTATLLAFKKAAKLGACRT